MDIKDAQTKLGNRNWRLDNLYYVQDEKGRKVKFHPRHVQLDLLHNLWYLNIILKSRQHGISTFIQIFILDMCLFNSNTAAGVIADTLTNAKNLLSKVHFAYENLPEEIKDIIKADVSSKTEIVFCSGFDEDGLTYVDGF